MTASRNNLSRTLMDHYGSLLGYVRRKVRSHETAQDILQETWLRIYDLQPGQPIDKPLAFLYRIASNLALDYLRQDKLRQQYMQDGDLPDCIPAPGPCQEDRLIAQEKLAQLAAVIEELPPKCREAFLLRKVRQLDTDEIARHMGISRNMVDKHLRRALEHCQRRLLGSDGS